LTNFRFPLASFPVRESFSHKSQLVTEILYGQLFSVIEEKESWKKIKIVADGYEGWIEFNHNFLSEDLELTVANFYSTINTQKGNVFIYPGAELSKSDLQNLNYQNSFSDIISLAKSYLNTPYLWGGKTPRGIDCSGFIQVLYATQNISLPRDACQQADIGVTINFEDKREGDLAFFLNENGKIIHVGLVIDQNCIIHASELVRVDILTDDGIWNNELNKLTHNLFSIKRPIH